MNAEQTVGPERLQKLLARAGFASRRKVEEMIGEGRVTINGAVAGLGDKADPAHDAVKVDGKRVQLSAVEHLYLLLNKPKGVMSTVSDPEGRRTVLELVPKALRKGLVPVGRLDFATEGLLLLTTDGEFAHHVSHPRYGCTKLYEVKVAGKPEDKDLDKLRGGIVLEGKRTSPCRIEPGRSGVLPKPVTGRAKSSRQGSAHASSGEKRRPGAAEAKDSSWWSVELAEGRTRQIREMFARIGHPVQKLRRVGIGALTDPTLGVGGLRELTSKEVEKLLRSTRKVRPKAEPGTLLPRRPAERPPARERRKSPTAASATRMGVGPAASPEARAPRRLGAARPVARSSERPASRSIARPADLPADRPPARPSARPAARPAARAGAKATGAKAAAPKTTARPRAATGRTTKAATGRPAARTTKVAAGRTTKAATGRPAARATKAGPASAGARPRRASPPAGTPRPRKPRS